MGQVGVRVEEEDMRTGARHHCCSAYLTFVSVLARPGADGRPARRMKRVAPTLHNHHEIFEAAERCARPFPVPLTSRGELMSVSICRHSLQQGPIARSYLLTALSITHQGPENCQ